MKKADSRAAAELRQVAEMLAQLSNAGDTPALIQLLAGAAKPLLHHVPPSVAAIRRS